MSPISNMWLTLIPRPMPRTIFIVLAGPAVSAKRAALLPLSTIEDGRNFIGNLCQLAGRDAQGTFLKCVLKQGLRQEARGIFPKCVLKQDLRQEARGIFPKCVLKQDVRQEAQATFPKCVPKQDLRQEARGTFPKCV